MQLCAALRADARALVAFGSRHPLSSTDLSNRGVGAARDWLKARFDAVGAGSTLTVTASFSHDFGNIDLFLYAIDGQTLLDSSEGLGDEEVVSTTTPATTGGNRRRSMPRAREAPKTISARPPAKAAPHMAAGPSCAATGASVTITP